MAVCSRYVEVFAGMAWVYLTKPRARENVVNDINGNLINLFSVARDQPEELVRLVELTPYARSQYNDWYNLYFKRKEEFTQLSPLKRAVIYYFILHSAYNSELITHPKLDTVSFKSSGSWGSPGMLDNIRQWSKWTQGTVFLNMDYKEVIERFASPETLFYLDPPYTVAENRSHYEFNFNESEHKELAERIKLCSSNTASKFVISYDDSELIKKLYKEEPFHITVIKDVFQSASSANAELTYKNELVITNFHPLKVGLFE